MIDFEYAGVFSIFFLHSVALLTFCPSRYKLFKTMMLWCGLALFSTLLSLVLLALLPNYMGATVVMCITAIFAVLFALHMSTHGIAKTLFLFLTYTHVFMIILYIAHLIPHLFFEDSIVISILIRSILHISLILLYFIFIRSKFDEISRDTKKGWWSLNAVILLLLTNACILLIRSYAFTYEQVETISFLLLMMSTVAVYWLFFHTISYMKTVVEAQRLELQSEFLMRQVEDMRNYVDNAQRIHHDARHHNLQIVEYLRNGEHDELINYLHQYEKESQSHLPIRICENIAANNILNAYARKAEQNGIDISFDISMEQDVGFKDIDIVAILANLMENAINGCNCSNQTYQFIGLSIGRKAGKLVIQSRNTANMNVVFENGLPKSKHNRGVGVSSILYSARNYEGETYFQNDNGVFVCRILLKIPQKATL